MAEKIEKKKTKIVKTAKKVVKEIQETPVKVVKKPTKAEKSEVKKSEVKTEKKEETKTENKSEVKKEVKKEAKKPIVEPPKKKIVMYTAVGRRKTATAFVKLVADPQKKEKTFTVNGRPVETYFSLIQQKKVFLEPLRTTNTINRFDVVVKVSGSGTTGQLGAVIHGLSRALLKVDPERFGLILRKRSFMTRDPRAKERNKVGLMGARHVKQSPRR